MYELAKNVNLELIPSNKYKEITYMFKFIKKYNPDEALNDVCLTELVGEYSQIYPTKTQMASAKNKLYGNRVGATRQISTEYESISFYYHFLNPKYVKDMTLADQCDYIQETLFHPYFSEELIEEFKRLYTAKMLRRFENPTAILKENVLNTLGSHNHLRYLCVDHRDLVQKLNLTTLLQAYHKMMEESTIYIYVIGDFDQKTLLEHFKVFPFNDRALTEIVNQKVMIEDLGYHTISRDFSQSYLNVVYQCDYSNNQLDYYKWLITDAFLGMVPNSILFKEIREKRSLCYNVSSELYKPDGISIVSSAFSYANQTEMLELIDQCVAMLANKTFNEEDLMATKNYVTNIMLSNEDDAKSYINYLHSQNILKSDLSIQDVVKLINDVSAEDVSEVAKTYKRRLVYVLRGNQDGIN